MAKWDYMGIFIIDKEEFHNFVFLYTLIPVLLQELAYSGLFLGYLQLHAIKVLSAVKLIYFKCICLFIIHQIIKYC